MVTRKDLKEKNVRGIEEYFEICLDKIAFGLDEEAEEMVHKFSQRQRNQFEVWLNDCPFHWHYINVAKKMIPRRNIQTTK